MSFRNKRLILESRINYVTWVKILTSKNIEKQGQMRTYKPGDWVNVGKQLALRWVANNEAFIPETDISGFIDHVNTGILVTGSEKAGKLTLAPFANKLSVTFSEDVELRWPKTMIWNPSVVLRSELVPVGFHLLDTWQVACPIWDYEKLACDIGKKEDKDRTEKLIHDLRVPLYNVNLIYIKRCGDTQYLLDCWQEERLDSTDQYHSFLRAVYRAKPLILALPTTWTNANLAYEDK